jgi:SAM-dependent methyltransferase
MRNGLPPEQVLPGAIGATSPETTYIDKSNPAAYANEMGRYRTERQLGFVLRFLSRGGLRILDIGGGFGRLAVPLANLGHEVTVVDEGERAVKSLVELKHPRIKAVHGNILSFEPTTRFDLALGVDSIKYMTGVPLPELFSKFSRFLVPQGIFILAEMNTNSWRYKIARRLGRFSVYNIDSHAGYVAALQKSRFKVVGASGSHWMPFRYNSNSFLVKHFARLEKMLRLERWISQSSWVMIAARNDESLISDPR